MIRFNITPTIVTGKLLSLLAEIDADRFKHVVVLTSPSVLKHPSVEQFLNNLNEKVKVSLFKDVKPDAPIAYIDQIIDNTAKPDLIIAIGGGSVIDSAKALSVGWEGIPLTDLFYAKEKLPLNKVKVFAIPTTAGTGAELSYGAILFDEIKQIKGGIRGALIQPDQVILDVELYSSAPAKLIAEVGFDCLTHAIETYISTASSPLTRYQSVAAINVVFRDLKSAVTTKSKTSIENMAISAAMMGINLALSSTCLPHRIQYAVGPATHTSHAQGLIALYKGWLKEISKTTEFENLAADLQLTVEDLVQKIFLLKKELDIDYDLTSLGLKAKDLESIAQKVTGNMNNDPCYQSIETIVNILKNSI